MPSLIPIRERNRIEVIDILRGVAIFGILLVNMFSFSNTVEVWGQGIHAWDSTADKIAVLLVQFLAEAKFYTLFSFLFGWGLALQLQRARARGAAFVPIYLRRLAILLLIGLTHAIFIWSGDILVTYALVGFILFLLRNRSDRTLTIVGLRISPTVAGGLLTGSGLTLDDLSIHYESISLATSAHIDIPIAVDEEAVGRNVLGVLPGRDPEYIYEIVILGGHYDHLGQDPDGTAWVGANDNASGIATLLEIARIWQEVGYVPRRTVLFSAWDAEEQGLLGSVHYVTNPIYPLDNTIAMLQLDMVGAGDDTLFVDGGGPVADQIMAVAEKLDTASAPSDGGRSDHTPFRVAGVPASLMIWFGDDATAVPHYHRPADTPDVIEPDKLLAAGRIAGMTALSFAEGEPAIQDLLHARAAALLAGDESNFLQLATARTEPAQRYWFDDLAVLDLVEVTMTPTDQIMAGDVATTTIKTEITYQQDDLARKKLTISQDARLRREDGGWRWDDPTLVENQIDGGTITVAHAKPVDANDIAETAAQRYAEVAALLGLSENARASILLYPDRKSLHSDTAPVSAGATTWVGPETIKLVASPTISQTLADAVTQLVLANAGMEENDAPWLWRGLPAALNTFDDPLKQADYIPILATTLQPEDALPAQQAADWAKVEYLRRQMGWEGVGQIVQRLGRGQPLDEALGMNASAFEDAWLADWRDRIRQTTAALDALLLARQNAVVAGDEQAFLRTIATNDPAILADEQAWWRQIQAQGVADFALEGRPLAYFDDDILLTQVKTRYRSGETEANTANSTLNVRLAPGPEGFYWAGPNLDTITAEQVKVRYPPRQKELAEQVLAEVETILAELDPDLNTLPGHPISIRLHDDGKDLRAWSPTLLPNWMTAWSLPGSSVHWVTPADGDIESGRGALIHAVVRHVLWEELDCQNPGDDACPHWLIEGLAAYESARQQGAAGRQEMARSLPTLENNISRHRIGPLSDIPALHTLSEKEADTASAQAREMARFLIDTAGWQSIRTLSAADLDALEMTWHQTLVRGYADNAWLEIASGFDQDAALAHIEALTKPEFGGRQAGSPGSESAAQYIAETFAAYGLTPYEDLSGLPRPDRSNGDDDFMQRFPISYTVLSALPTLDVLDPGSLALTSRQDFLTANRGILAGGIAENEVVWVRDDYGDMQLGGKIVIKPLDKTVAAEMEEAIAHSAGGLLLVGTRQGKTLLAKHPLPVTTPDAPSIPVLELTQDGLEKLVGVSDYRLGEIYGLPPALPLGVRIRMDIPLTPPEVVQSANVLGILPGSDPELSDEVIILGAHYDHVGDDPDLRYSGANDNASGVAVLLEIIRLWHETDYRPKRSILFAAWDAQEPGEIGSQFYVDNPAIPLENTVVMLQLDSVAGGTGYYLEAQGERRTKATLRFAMDRAAELMESRLTLENPEGRSDQIPFQEAGIPSLLLIWKGANEGNRPDDIADEIEAYRLGMTGRAVALGVMMLAEGRLP